MILEWQVRYLDTRDRSIKDRFLLLDTSALDCATQAAVELTLADQEAGPDRRILKYRRLFHETSLEELQDLTSTRRHEQFSCFFVPEYFEDENGNDIPHKRVAEILTGRSDATMYPSHYRRHDITLCQSPGPVSIDLANIHLSQEELDALAFFCRDAAELLNCQFIKNGRWQVMLAGPHSAFKTSLSADEIVSFVTIFRRLYMTTEQGCFVNACSVFASKIDHPLGRWVEAEKAEYEVQLNEPIRCMGWQHESATLPTAKQLLDAFIYTRFAHQPQIKHRKRYTALLEHAKSEDLLMWCFCTTALRIGAHYINVEGWVSGFLKTYMVAHRASPSISQEPIHRQPGLDAIAKPELRRSLLFAVKVQELAIDLWKEAGQPVGGYEPFIPEANRQLKEVLGGDEQSHG